MVGDGFRSFDCIVYETSLFTVGRHEGGIKLWSYSPFPDYARRLEGGDGADFCCVRMHLEEKKLSLKPKK